MIDGEHCPLREFACKVNFPKTIENFCLLSYIISFLMAIGEAWFSLLPVMMRQVLLKRWAVLAG